MDQQKTSIAQRAGAITVLLSCLLVGIKLFAYWASGSSAVLASLSDSIMDSVVSGLNLIAIWYSSRPADADHRYGHGKIEGLAALFQFLLLSAVAVLLLWHGVVNWGHFQKPEALVEVILLMVVSAAISWLILWVQRRAIDRSGSLALESDHTHYTADLVQYVGVLVPLGVAMFAGPAWVDSFCAILIALWMLYCSIEIGRKGLDMILDRELPDEGRQAILAVIRQHAEVLGVHDLRAIRSGMKVLVFFDIEVSDQMSLIEAHDITKDLESEILDLYPGAEIMIHVDPHGDIDDSRHSVEGVHH